MYFKTWHMSRIRAHLIFSMQITCEQQLSTLLILWLYKKNRQFTVRFGEGGGHKKEYSLYAFINVDSCERPLSALSWHFFLYIIRRHNLVTQQIKDYLKKHYMWQNLKQEDLKFGMI